MRCLTASGFFYNGKSFLMPQQRERGRIIEKRSISETCLGVCHISISLAEHTAIRINCWCAFQLMHSTYSTFQPARTVNPSLIIGVGRPGRVLMYAYGKRSRALTAARRSFLELESRGVLLESTHAADRCQNSHSDTVMRPLRSRSVIY